LSKNIQSVVADLLNPYLDDNDFELVDIEYVKEGGNWFLRVYVDKEGGIDIEECGKISEFLSNKLDEKDPIPGAYFLEVSSPGAERPLKTAKDYNRAINKYVFVKTYEPVDGVKQFEGKLISFDEKTLIIQTKKKEFAVPLEIVASARLAVVF
jgi:ribosome maturation factor RimP